MRPGPSTTTPGRPRPADRRHRGRERRRRLRAAAAGLARAAGGARRARRDGQPPAATPAPTRVAGRSQVAGSSVQVALADDPDGQRQLPAGWDLERGDLLLMGIPGSGTSTTLSSLALTLADGFQPDELDLLVLDLGSRDLAPLAGLPHTAAYVGSGPPRASSRSACSARARPSSTGAGPRRARTATVVLIDGLAALKDEYDDFEGIKLLEGSTARERRAGGRAVGSPRRPRAPRPCRRRSTRSPRRMALPARGRLRLRGGGRAGEVRPGRPSPGAA